MIARRFVRARRELHGHYWTVGSFVRGIVRPLIAPHDQPFATSLCDPVAGEVEVTGRLSVPIEGARDALIVLHGLGGDVSSRYVLLAARAAREAGMAVLRLNLRGADRRGGDVYHAGLTADLDAAIESAALAGFERLYVLGYSLGGHVALSWASARGEHPRVRAVAAVCPPVDLAAGVRAIQRLDRRPYQRHVLRGLKDQYSAVARRHGERTAIAPITIERVQRLRTIVEWDDEVIAPRFGFAGAEDYYARAGIGPRLGALRIPALLVAASADPMIPSATVRPGLAGASDALRVVWARRGGHVGFPDDLALGLSEPGVHASRGGAGIESEVVGWLLSRR